MSVTEYKICPDNIVEIPLTQGQVTFIDRADLSIVIGHKWYAGYYPSINGWYAKTNRKGTVLMHRLLMGDPDCLVDHINGDTLNNRRSNLRLATKSQSNINRGKQKGTSSKYKGVRWHQRKWMAEIKVDGKTRYLGTFEIEEDAGRAYDKIAKELHGEFANLNFPNET